MPKDIYTDDEIEFSADNSFSPSKHNHPAQGGGIMNYILIVLIALVGVMILQNLILVDATGFGRVSR